jgi:hypothetical protein
MRTQVVDLGDDVLQADRAHAIMTMEMGRAGRHDMLGSGAMAQPGHHVGHALGRFGAASAFIAPQSEWPQTMMSRTPRATTAYSTVEDTPPFMVE